VKCERSRRRPLVSLNAISRRDVRSWESMRPPQEHPRKGPRAGTAGDDRRGLGPHRWPRSRQRWGMTRLTDPAPSTVMRAPWSPKRTLTPAATKQQPPLARLRKLFSGRDVAYVTQEKPEVSEQFSKSARQVRATILRQGPRTVCRCAGDGGGQLRRGAARLCARVSSVRTERLSGFAC
jgi:hypothetical protein